MKTTWTKGLEGDAKEDMVNAFHHNTLLRGRLKSILEEKITTNLRARRREDGYNSPNWAFQQADSVGYERALEEVISLLTEKS